MATDQKLHVLLVRPMCLPREVTLEGSLESLQASVGGMIQCVYPFDAPVGIVCNDEGKLLGLPPNRPLRGADGQVYDILCGNFLVVGLGEDDFRSLTRQEMSYFKDFFSREMIFTRPPDLGRSR